MTAQAPTLAGAVNAALRDAMREDDRVVVYGEDVGKLGGVFRVTDGLTQLFGEQRCFDSPLAESGILGTAVGMAMYGYRPVVEMQFDAFAYPAFEQIVSHVAKFRSRTRGLMGLPLVVRVPYGGGIGGVEHHSDSSETYYAHTPGLHVAVPSNPTDAYTLLRAAIGSDDPVVFFEPKKLYWAKDEGPADDPAPFGRAVVRRPGTSATLIAYGPTVPTALRAAEEAAARGQDVEVVDLRTLVPLDEETVVASVRRTGRAVVVHESHGFCGMGAEISALLTEQAFAQLQAPVLRVTGMDVPYPPPRLEHFYLPTEQRIADALDSVHGQAWRAPGQQRRGTHPGGIPAVADAPGTQSFLLPDLGEGLTEGQVVQWLVDPGDTVEVDQPVVEVETAKAVTELPSPYAGRVRELCARVGETVAVGSPLLTTEPAGTAAAPRPAPFPGADAVPGPRPPERALVGFGTAPGAEDGQTSADLRIPLDGMRGAVARKTVVSRREIPDVTVWLDVDVTALVAARAAARESASGVPSLSAVLACYAVEALGRYPALNARVDTARDCVVQLAEISLGLTVQTDRGLLVPAVRRAGRLGPSDLAEEADRVIAATLKGALTDVAVGQGTFTVNNYGALGVDGATPIINHPEAAMLGMGRIVDRPWATGDEIAIRNVTTLSVTFDHRVCDGDVAAGFLRGVAGLLEAGRLPRELPGE